MKVGPSRYSQGGAVTWSHYAESGETSIVVMGDGGAPQYVATVALWPPSPVADGAHVWLRTWNECEGVPGALAKAGVVVLLDRFESTGHVLAQLARLTPAAIAELTLQYAGHPNAALAREESRRQARLAGRTIAPTQEN